MVPRAVLDLDPLHLTAIGGPERHQETHLLLAQDRGDEPRRAVRARGDPLRVVEDAPERDRAQQGAEGPGADRDLLRPYGRAPQHGAGEAQGGQERSTRGGRSIEGHAGDLTRSRPATQVSRIVLRNVRPDARLQ